MVLGSEIVLEYLKMEGVQHIFGLSAHSITPILDAMIEVPEIRFIPVRHEQVAGLAGLGYSRVSGSPAVLLVQVGPGLMNAATAIANAYVDEHPMVVVGGGPSDKEAMGKDQPHGFINWPHLMEPITKYSTLVSDIAEVPRELQRAFQLSTSGVMGPTYVQILTDVLSGSMLERPVLRKRVPLGRIGGDPQNIMEGLKLLVDADRPVVLSGAGSIYSDAGDELVGLAENLAMPVITSYPGRGVIPEDHLLSAGHSTTRASQHLLSEADVILLIGSRLTTMHRRWARIPENLKNDVKIIQVDIDPGRIGKNLPVDIGIVGDAKQVLRDLLDGMMQLNMEREELAGKRAADIERIRNEEIEELMPKIVSDSKPINPLRLIHDVRESLERDAILTADGGNNEWWARHFAIYEPRTMLLSSGYGTMGIAFPAALGAKLAAPDRQVVCITGDSGFMMVLQDLETAVRCDIPVIVVVMNDFGHGRIKIVQERFYKRTFGTDVTNPDFAKLAELFGAYGERVEEPSKIKPAMQRAIAKNMPAVLDVIIDKDEKPPILIGEYLTGYGH